MALAYQMSPQAACQPTQWSKQKQGRRGPPLSARWVMQSLHTCAVLLEFPGSCSRLFSTAFSGGSIAGADFNLPLSGG